MYDRKLQWGYFQNDTAVTMMKTMCKLYLKDETGIWTLPNPSGRLLTGVLKVIYKFKTLSILFLMVTLLTFYKIKGKKREFSIYYHIR